MESLDIDSLSDAEILEALPYEVLKELLAIRMTDAQFRADFKEALLNHRPTNTF